MNSENLISHEIVQKMESFEQIWESATIADDFIFGKVMENPEICREFLEALLNEKLRVFLQYIVDGTISGSFVKKIDKEVSRLKQSSEMRRIYMEAWMQEAVTREQALEEGRAEGKFEHLRSLIEIKLQKGKSLEQIADELEENVENIKHIYDEIVSA